MDRAADCSAWPLIRSFEFRRSEPKRGEGRAIRERDLRLLTEWASAHREELQANWDKARRHEPLEKIAPLP